MNRPAAQPDYPLADLLQKLSVLLKAESGVRGHDLDLNARIMDAVFLHDLLSWGRKDGGAKRELIPQLAWEMGEFDRRAGKLVHRHPDSPLPEEYTDIEFNRAEVEPWLRELRSGRDARA